MVYWIFGTSSYVEYHTSCVEAILESKFLWALDSISLWTFTEENVAGTFSSPPRFPIAHKG